MKWCDRRVFPPAMNTLPHETVPPVLQLGLGLLLAASAVVWSAIGYRASRGLPVLPYQRRHPVPWRLIDLAGILLVYLLLVYWIVFATEWWLGVDLRQRGRGRAALAAAADAAPGARPNKAPKDVPPPQLDHPIFVMLRQRPDPAVLLFAVVVAGVVVPVTEEFAFRLLLQGWLEALERRWRRRVAVLRRLAPGVVPIVVVSGLFALGHWRTEGPPPDVWTLICNLTILAIAAVVTLGFAVWLIWHRWNATGVDFGFVPARFTADVRLGVLAYLACVPPVLLIQSAAMQVLPAWIAPDPIALFFFALALSLLYFRTHRIVPSIVLHMGLNLTSLGVAWLVVTR